MLFKPAKLIHSDVVCFTTSTLGGVSNKPFESLNLGDHVGDEAHLVKENRIILENILADETNKVISLDQRKINPIKWLKQAHTSQHTFYNKYSRARPCDSISTVQLFTPLVIMTADCMPIVMSSRSGQISAIHAGWRGLLSNVIENVVSKYNASESISAWIGPSICNKHFEITEELLPVFKCYSNYVVQQRPTKYSVDLVGIATEKLKSLGIDSVQTSDVCSYHHKNCFSHRRATHLGLSSTGRMATVIMRVK